MPAHLAFDDAMLGELRRMPAEEVLRGLAIQMKADTTYVPRKNPASRRWHVLTERGDFEILTTGHKWFDTHENRGGASAVDLAMHLLGVPFVEAVKRLTERRRRPIVGSSGASQRTEVETRTTVRRK
jgi:hypothetical protein